jgi:hypothetical protein
MAPSYFATQKEGLQQLILYIELGRRLKFDTSIEEEEKVRNRLKGEFPEGLPA